MAGINERVVEDEDADEDAGEVGMALCVSFAQTTDAMANESNQWERKRNEKA